MHRTVTITIGGILFHVEDDAFTELDAYLSSIRKHFAAHADTEEIITDIENRIAEEFSEHLKGKRKAVTLADVEALIARMGTVEDFRKFEGDAAEKPPGGKERDKSPLFRGRLYRDVDDQVLGGVCAGIANYAGIDPTIVRLLFAASIFFGGLGVILYIVLWVILPEAKTTTEKLEMEQKRVTLSAIQQRVKEQIRNPGTRHAARKIVAIPILILRRLMEALRKVLPLLGSAIGFLIILGIALAIAGLTSGLILLILNPATAFVDFPLEAVVGRTSFLILLLSGYALAFLPLILLLTAGASLMDRKNGFSATGLLTFIALWTGALVIFTVTGFSHAPAIRSAAEKIADERVQMVQQRFDLQDFQRIEAGGATTLSVRQGDAYAIVLEGTPQEVERTEVKAEDGTLRVIHNPFNRSCFFFCGTRRIKLDITMPELRSMTLDGAARGSVRGFTGSTSAFKLSGASSFEGELTAENLTLDLSGSSHAVLMGSGAGLRLMLSGASGVDASRFVVRTVDVEASGASNAQLNAMEAVTGSLSGASRITFAKRPPTVNVRTSGASRVEEAEQTDWDPIMKEDESIEPMDW